MGLEMPRHTPFLFFLNVVLRFAHFWKMGHSWCVCAFFRLYIDSQMEEVHFTQHPYRKPLLAGGVTDDFFQQSYIALNCIVSRTELSMFGLIFSGAPGIILQISGAFLSGKTMPGLTTADRVTVYELFINSVQRGRDRHNVGMGGGIAKSPP